MNSRSGNDASRHSGSCSATFSTGRGYFGAILFLARQSRAERFQAQGGTGILPARTEEVVLRRPVAELECLGDRRKTGNLLREKRIWAFWVVRFGLTEVEKVVE